MALNMELHQVGANGRVALGELAKDVKFFHAHQDSEGVITLTPVNVVTPTAKRGPATDQETLFDEGDAPEGE
jgi:hypothetical protein